MNVVHKADVLDALRAMPDNSFHGCLTDPPYGLSFMGHQWDHGVPSVEVWREVLRVLRPGAHLLAFGGTRTFHRLTCAIEDAGFEIRDCMSWLYGSGFPKSLDVSKAIDREAGAVREVVGPDPQAARRNRASPQFGGSAMNEYDPGYDGPLGRMAITAPATEAALQWSGYGTAMKPAWEPIILARKPLEGTVAANVQRWGCGALAIDACRVPGLADKPGGRIRSVRHFDGHETGRADKDAPEPNPLGRWPANVILDGLEDPVLRLRNNVDQQVARVIRLYFCGMPDVRSGDPNVPESGEPEEVLRERLLREVAKREPERGESPHGRKAASPRFPGEDAGDKEGSRALKSGTELLQLEGRNVPDARLPNGGNESRGPRSIRWDGESVRLCDGAPSRDGSQAGSPTDFQGSGSPSERNEDGQQDPEPRAFGQRDAQAGAPSDRSGASAPEARERAIEVRASQIPEGWLSYFEPTGRVISGEAGAALDAQSGKRPSASNTKPSTGGTIMSGLSGEARPNGYRAFANGNPYRGENGGASRFFYCAKASRAERDAGLEGFAAASGGEATHREDGSPGTKSPRAGAGRNGGSKNIHPTVKPIDLARYLARLILPPVADSRLLVPFCGSGSEMIGGLRAGWSHVEGIDSWDVAVRIARARLAHAAAGVP